MWLKISSRRSIEKLKKAGVTFLQFVNWGTSSGYYCLTYGRNYDVVRGIKGVKVLKKRPSGPLTKCWYVPRI
jgi:hypothetical protein